MVIVDTSVWVEFMRSGDQRVSEWVAADAILQHPFVTAELGMGSFRSAAERSRVIELLDSFTQIEPAESAAFHDFVGSQSLYGTGIGFADAHLLHTCAINPDACLVTRDKRLAEQAERLGLALV